MVHSFKYGGYRFAYDTVSGTLFRFDELTYKMLDYIGLPMPVDCPSALRYDLAKYDSMAIDDAYDALYALSKEGKIFVPENGAEIVRPSVTDPVLVLSDGTVVSHGNPHIPESAYSFDNADIRIVSGDAPLTAEDMTTLAKEIDKLTREYLKRGDGRAFAPVDGDKPGKPVGVGCFTVGEKSVSDELFAKRAESVLALGSEEKK